MDKILNSTMSVSYLLPEYFADYESILIIISI